MQDLQQARQILTEGGYTCVLCHGESVHTSMKRGVAPMVEWIENGVSLQGYSAADKVIGKAAAMLFVLAGVSSVYSEVMSRAAEEFLTLNGEEHSYGSLTDMIINRRGHLRHHYPLPPSACRYGGQVLPYSPSVRQKRGCH